MLDHDAILPSRRIDGDSNCKIGAEYLEATPKSPNTRSIGFITILHSGLKSCFTVRPVLHR